MAEMSTHVNPFFVGMLFLKYIEKGDKKGET